MKNNFHIGRVLTKANTDFAPEFFANRNELTLEDVITSNDKIILLGEPGIGKSKELKHLFDHLTSTIENHEFYPFFVPLNLFSKYYTSLEEFLKHSFPQWDNHPNKILILDGLDELEDINDFLSDLRLFERIHKDKQIKYVISCRSNIFSKYSIKIPGYEEYLLSEFTLDQVKEFISNQDAGLSIEEISGFIDYRNPFYLKLLIRHLKSNGKLPQSHLELWNEFILSSLKSDFGKDLKKRPEIDRFVLFEMLRRTALINELMHKNYLKEEELFKIHGVDWSRFIENPFLIYDEKVKAWTFTHRQIQEFLVSSSLEKKDLSTILPFICVEGQNSIHPTMFNSVSFLLNIIQEEKKKNELIGWLIENQLAPLINADASRIDDSVRVRVLQDYFHDYCVKKKLWLNTNNSIAIETLARFGNTRQNFDYLIKIITDLDLNNRAIFGALELLKYFDFPKEELDEYKSKIKDLILDKSIPSGYRSELIRLVDSNFQLKTNEKYLVELILDLKDEDIRLINSSLLDLVDSLTEPDLVFEYVIEEFKREFNIVPVTDDDTVIRSNGLKLKQLFFRLKDPNNITEILQYYPSTSFKDHFFKDDSIKLTELCVNLFQEGDEYLRKFLSGFQDKYQLHQHETLLGRVLNVSHKVDPAISILLEEFEFDKISLSIATLANSKSLNKIVDTITKNNSTQIEIEKFRNYLSNTNSYELAKEFESIMIKKGIIFKETLVTPSEKESYKDKAKETIVTSIKDLLERDVLLKKIAQLFKDNGISRIDLEGISQLERNWYSENGHGSILPAHISLVERILRIPSGSELKEILRLIEENDLIRFDELKRVTKRSSGNPWNIKLNQNQIEQISQWIEREIKELDFSQFIIFNTPTNFTEKYDFRIFQLIHYFSREYNIELGQDFLLDSLEFIGFKSSNSEEDFQSIQKRILDKSAFDERIKTNLIEKNLLYFSKPWHIKYALESRMVDTYPVIEKYILNNSPYIDAHTILKEYYFQSRSIEFLKECCKDVDKSICWSAIGLLANENVEKEFCVSKAIDYLEGEGINNVASALRTLFLLEDDRALKYYIRFVQEEDHIRSLENSYQEYSVLRSVNDLEILYNIMEKKLKEDEVTYYDVFDFLKIYTSNLIKKEADIYSEIMDLWKRLRTEREKTGQEVFYINSLIEVAEKSFVSARSKPYSMSEALLKVESIASA